MMNTRVWGVLLIVAMLAMVPDAIGVESAIPKALIRAELQHDALTSAEPGQVSLNGYLNGRVIASERGRLLDVVSEDELLAGFRSRPGSHPWIGEHVGKWLHAAVLSELYTGDRELLAKINRVADGLMDCQMDDGYLGTYDLNGRWTVRNDTGWDVWVHKYVLIGLLNVYRLRGDERSLQTCERIGDLLIDTFGEGKRDILESGTHAGMAATSILEPMCLLYQYSGKEKYLRFCRYIVDRADAGPGLMRNIELTGTVQSVGNKKAYEMMSNYVGLVEYWRITGDERPLRAAILAWDSIAKENTFITGAVDAHEHFSDPFTLDSQGRCTETCVQTTWVQLNWELLRATGDARYAAMLHHHLYNHMLAAQNDDGMQWCYFTPMEGGKMEDEWAGFSKTIHCCGSSGPRAIAMIPTLAFMSGDHSIAVNLYESSSYQTTINGINVSVSLKTNYPWDGDVQLTVKTDKPVSFDLRLLIPDFVSEASLQLNGREEKLALPAGEYASIQREWSGETRVSLQFETPLAVHEWNGRYALSKGPFILAAEKEEGQNAALTGLVPDLQWIRGHAKTKWKNSAIQAPCVARDSNSSDEAMMTFKPFSETSEHGERYSIFLPMMPEKQE